MKALYRKYRPTKLSEVLGQEQVVKPLEASLKSGKISHAYLFTGPRGCGKTSVARIFAHEINKFPYKIEDSYVDIIEIDAASNTGVDNIRDLREKAAIAPSEGKFKVYIIDEVHMLSKAAFNALLKTLEEPPKHVIFIMATTDAYKVPITITSRAQNYRFELAAPDVMLKCLKNIAKKEGIAVNDDALGVIVEKGGGSFRDSISLLDQISALSDTKITKEAVTGTLGLPENTEVDGLLAAYKQGNVTEISNLLKNVLNSGKKPEILAENLINRILEAPEPELLPLLEKLPTVQNPFAEAKILLAFLSEAAKTPLFHVGTPNLGGTAVRAERAPAAGGATSATGDAAGGTPAARRREPSTVGETAAAEPVASRNAQVPAEHDGGSAVTGPVATGEINLDWDKYLQSVKSSSPAVSSTLEKCTHSLENSRLTIFTERKFHKTILESANNRQILEKFLPQGLELVIEDGSEIVKKDQNLGQISDIMGDIQEVKSSGVPF